MSTAPGLTSIDQSAQRTTAEEVINGDIHIVIHNKLGTITIFKFNSEISGFLMVLEHERAHWAFEETSLQVHVVNP